jgi:membrane protein
MVRAADDAQRRFPGVGFPLAVVYKYFDDQGPYLAAIITYYTFVAVFPLLLLGTSILGFVLQGDPELRQAALDSTLRQFPRSSPAA